MSISVELAPRFPRGSNSMDETFVSSNGWCDLYFFTVVINDSFRHAVLYECYEKQRC